MLQYSSGVGFAPPRPPRKEQHHVGRRRHRRPDPNRLAESDCSWLGKESFAGGRDTVLYHGPEYLGAAGERKFHWLVERSRAAGERSRGSRDSADRGRNEVGRSGLGPPHPPGRRTASVQVLTCGIL